MKQRGLNEADLERVKADSKNMVLSEEVTCPKQILDFSDFRKRTYELIDLVLRGETVPEEVESTYEIPTLYDIIVRHDFTETDRAKVDFLLHAHECRLANKPIEFGEEMMKLCQK